MVTLYDKKTGRIVDLKHAYAIYAVKNSIIVCFPFTDGGNIVCEEFTVDGEVDEKEMRRFLDTIARNKNNDEFTPLYWQKICRNLRKQKK